MTVDTVSVSGQQCRLSWLTRENELEIRVTKELIIHYTQSPLPLVQYTNCLPRHKNQSSDNFSAYPRTTSKATQILHKCWKDNFWLPSFLLAYQFTWQKSQRICTSIMAKKFSVLREKYVLVILYGFFSYFFLDSSFLCIEISYNPLFDYIIRAVSLFCVSYKN